jgi:hypothetical protein
MVHTVTEEEGERYLWVVAILKACTMSGNTVFDQCDYAISQS